MVDDTCESVPLDSTVNFDVTVTLNSCEGLTNGQLIRLTYTLSVMMLVLHSYNIFML